MRWILSSIAVAAVLAGCSGDQEADGTGQDSGRGVEEAECTPQVRFQGSVYTAVGYSSEPVTKVGLADNANCSDVGKDAIGSYFPDDPQQVEVWSFAAYPASEVLAVRGVDEVVDVFVSENVEADQAAQIATNLGPAVSRPRQ